MAERVEALKKREKDAPNAYAALHRAWSALLPEAEGTPHGSVARERLEILEGEANRAYRETYRPVQIEIRDLVAQGQADRAHALLKEWRIREEFDIGGRLTQERLDELARLKMLVRVHDLARGLRKEYETGDAGKAPDKVLSEYLDSNQVFIAAEADRVARSLGQLRRMELCRQRLVAGYRKPSDPWVFGASPGRSIPTERRFRERIPDSIKERYASLRSIARSLRNASSIVTFGPEVKRGVRIIDEAVRIEKWLPTTYYYRAEWRYGADGDPVSALTDLDEAIRRQKNFVEAHLARTLVLLDLGQLERATGELRRLSDALPDPLHGPLKAAHTHAEAGEPESSRRELVRAMEALPDDLELLELKAPVRAATRLPEWQEPISVETGHYILRTSRPEDATEASSREKELKHWSSILEAARSWFPNVLGGTPRAVRKPRVFLFTNREEYYRHSDQDAGDQLQHSAGRYLGRERALLLYQGSTRARTQEVLIHEAMHEYIGALGLDLPTWLDEGISDYASAVTIDDGKVTETGKLIGAQLRSLKRALEEGWLGIPPSELFRESSDEFHGVMESLKYDQAWSMVHFFKHGGNDRYKAAFEGYLEALSKGTKASRAYSTWLGPLNSAILHRDWRRYVFRLE